MNILVVDDDEEDRLVFCEAVSEILPRANCLQKSSCDQLTELLRNGTEIQAIFLDGFMYPTGGLECLKRVKELIDPTRTKLVVHSGGIMPSQRQEFLELGVDDILIKAADYSSLKASLRRLLIDKYQFSR